MVIAKKQDCWPKINIQKGNYYNFHFFGKYCLILTMKRKTVQKCNFPSK